MTAASRGRRRAHQPDTRWQPAERLPAGGAATSVRFIEETGGRSKTFDFAKLGVDVGLQQWFARVFARLTGPRSGVKRLTSARARRHPRSAEVGLEPEALMELINGGQDTALTSCTDHLTSPHGEAGQPSPASFLACLGCANARALPHHLPVQLAVRDRIRALRP